MFTQRYASHVMQTALEQASGFLLDKESKDEIITGPNGESIAELSSLICDIAHNIAPSFNDLICDSCSTHVVRILLCILCGYSSSYAKTKKHLKKGKASMNVCCSRLSADSLGKSRVPKSIRRFSLGIVWTIEWIIFRRYGSYSNKSGMFYCFVLWLVCFSCDSTAINDSSFFLFIVIVSINSTSIYLYHIFIL